MASILKNPDHVAKIGFNDFPMNQTIDFTMSTGHLIPIFYDVISPGDKFRANANIFLRTQPMESAATFSAKVRMDWFFVPMHQLYKFFGDAYYNIQDFGTDFAKVSDLNGVPSADSSNKTYPHFPVKETFITFLDNLRGFIGERATGHFDFTWDKVGDVANMRASFDSLRLLDALGFPVSQLYLNDYRSLYLDTDLGTASLFNLLAYQKIYYDYYRLTDREVNDPSAYNFDSWLNSALPTSFDTRFYKFAELHYIPYQKDFHTNVFVSPLQGSSDIGSFGNTEQLFNSWLTNTDFVTGIPSTNDNRGISTSDTNPTSVKPNILLSYLGDNFNTASIRQMFAVEKCLDITRRAAKHYDAQTLAHWGVKPPVGLDGEVLYLGSQTQPFIIGDVVSTAASADEPLGTIAGKGYSGASVNGARNESVNYDGHLNCHGIVMCIASVQPDAVYTQRGFDRLLRYTKPMDFIHLEFDNLGMQPYYQDSWFINPETQDFDDIFSILGWQYAYSENKLKQNRVFGGVHADGLLHTWVPQFDAELAPANGLGAYLVPPTYLNDVMVQPFVYDFSGQADSEFTEGNIYQLLYANDPFICHASVSYTKVSKMSKYSLIQI